MLFLLAVSSCKIYLLSKCGVCFQEISRSRWCASCKLNVCVGFVVEKVGSRRRKTIKLMYTICIIPCGSNLNALQFATARVTRPHPLSSRATPHSSHSLHVTPCHTNASHSISLHFSLHYRHHIKSSSASSTEVYLLRISALDVMFSDCWAVVGLCVEVFRC